MKYIARGPGDSKTVIYLPLKNVNEERNEMSNKMGLCALQGFQMSSKRGTERACIHGMRTTGQGGKCRSPAGIAWSNVTDVGETEKDL